MQYLLDTNALIWTLEGNKRIEPFLGEIINPRNEIFFSSASIWEIYLKEAKGKISLKPEVAFDAFIKQGFEELPITSEHISYIKTLMMPSEEVIHKDPFDRLLVAQAKAENMVFLTGDGVLCKYLEPCIKYIP